MKTIHIVYSSLIIIVLVSCSGNHTFYSKSKIDYKALWQYYNLTDTIQGAIISHYPAEAFCGMSATGSVSIIKTVSDTIRVLDLCNMNKIDVGSIVTIYPAEKPSFSVSLPASTATFMRNDTIYERPSDADLKILKTTWGQIR